VGQHISAILPNTIALNDAGKPVDLLDLTHLQHAVDRLEFDTVIHLAAQSFVPESFANPKRTFDINFIGTFNLLSALKAKGFTGKVLFVSSADVYGKVAEQNLPVTELQLPKPGNPYAVSKLAAEALCYQWFESEKMPIIIARPFNHIGPGQRECFAISSFAKQVMEIKYGKRQAKIEVGDIDVTRDFTDVRDIVLAYQKLLLQGKPGEIYNICSGVEHSLRSLLEKLLSLGKVEAQIVQDPQRMRRSDQQRVCGSFAKLQNDTKWQPMVAMQQTLNDLLDFWEKQIQ
jgi:GDP-4-dehydro-6-deoxy-D-mannose reductase